MSSANEVGSSFTDSTLSSRSTPHSRRASHRSERSGHANPNNPAAANAEPAPQPGVGRVPGNMSAWSQMTASQKLIWIIRLPIRFVVCALHVLVICFLSYLGYILPLLWARSLWPRLYWFCEGKLYSLMQASVGYWGYTVGYGIVEYGDDATKLSSERFLLLPNHQSRGDIPVLCALLQGKGVISRKVIWIMDVMFRWTSFGIVAQSHGDYFIRQGRSTRDSELARLKDYFQRVFWARDRHCVILFPEGGFTCNRLESSNKYATKHGFPVLRNVSLPRLGAISVILRTVGPRDDGGTPPPPAHPEAGGFVETVLRLLKYAFDELREKKHVQETRPPMKYILSVTIGYPHNIPMELTTLCFGTREPCDIGVHYKIYDLAEVPYQDDDKLRDFAYKMFKDKDELLETYKKKGVFVEGEVGRRVIFPWSKIVGQHVFWFASLCVLLVFYWWLLSAPLRFVGLIA